MKGQVVADFIVGHNIDQNSDESCNLVSIHPWNLFFDGSACREGQGVGVVLVSPKGVVFEQSVRLEYFCTNNQAEYEAIMLDLQIFSSTGVKHVETFNDSLLVVQQVVSKHQVSDQIKANLVFCKKWMFWFTESDTPVFGRCVVW
jgi:ribonuclease HI